MVTFIACSRGDAAKPVEPTQQDGPSCVAVVAKMREGTIAALRRGGADEAVLAEARKDLENVDPQLVKACTDDAWSVELRICLDTAPPLEVGERCEALITPAQLDAVMKIRGTDTQDRPPPGT